MRLTVFDQVGRIMLNKQASVVVDYDVVLSELCLCAVGAESLSDEFVIVSSAADSEQEVSYCNAFLHVY